MRQQWRGQCHVDSTTVPVCQTWMQQWRNMMCTATMGMTMAQRHQHNARSDNADDDCATSTAPPSTHATKHNGDDDSATAMAPLSMSIRVCMLTQGKKKISTSHLTYSPYPSPSSPLPPHNDDNGQI